MHTYIGLYSAVFMFCVQNKTSRVFLVPSSRAALSTLEDMLETHNNRLEQQEVFASTVRQLFLPEPSTGVISNECSAVASAHVAEVLRIWEGRFDLSPGEVDVLIPAAIDGVIHKDNMNKVKAKMYLFIRIFN